MRAGRTVAACMLFLLCFGQASAQQSEPDQAPVPTPTPLFPRRPQGTAGSKGDPSWVREHEHLRRTRSAEVGTLPHVPVDLEGEYWPVFLESIWLKADASLQMDSIVDTGAPGNPLSFKPSGLGKRSTSTAGMIALSPDSRIHFDRSRFSFDAYTPHPEFLQGVRVYFEGDFMGKEGSVQLRHATVAIPYLLVGLTDSAFRDVTAEPETIDSGPNGYFGLRQRGVRLILPFDRYKFVVGLEDEGGVYTPEGLLLSDDRLRDNADLTCHFRAQEEWGHLQLSGVFRRLRSQDYPGQQTTFPGGGVGLSGKVYLDGKDNLSFELSGGPGLGRYINDLSGTRSELGVDAQGRLGTQMCYGGYLAYQHWWDQRSRTNIFASSAHVAVRDGQSGSSYRSGTSLGINFIRDLSPDLRFGVEYIQGWLVRHDGSSASGGRLECMLRYNLPWP